MSSQKDYVNLLNSVNNKFQYYCLWTIFPTCIVGNLISFVIYTRPNLNKKTNAGFLYRWLCILNVIMIVFYCCVSRSNVLFKYTISFFPCGVENYIRRTTLNATAWMQVVICLDRFIVVFFPAKSAFISKKSVLYGIMLAFLALILITNMTNLLSYPVNISPNATICFMSDEASVATSLIASLMRVFIPFGVMLTLNLLVVRRLKRSKVRVSVLSLIKVGSQTQNKSRPLTRKEFKFIVSTLIIDFVYLFFYLPLGIAFIIQTYNIFDDSINFNPLASAIYNLYNYVSQFFAISHTSALFFIFVIFNRFFRTELIVLLRLDKVFPSLQTESGILAPTIRSYNLNRNNAQTHYS